MIAFTAIGDKLVSYKTKTYVRNNKHWIKWRRISNLL